MRKIKRIAASFAIVMIAYWAYALTAVPLIEPAAELTSNGAINPDQHDAPPDLAGVQLAQIRPLFTPGDWELDNPIILECNRAKLLFKQYFNQPDGSVKLDRCTIVFDNDGQAEDEEQRIRQSIVLEAPDGAVLKFDKPLELNRAKIGQLKSGQLFGEVKIRSDWKQKGPEDDLVVVTRDVQLNDQTVFTPHPVNFRWGPHFGSGREMTIQLLPKKRRRGEPRDGPNIAGIKSFELAHVDRLHLDLGQSISPTEKQPESMPVEINCRGPFRFDAVKQEAVFCDGVDVLKPNPAGPSDQIACDTLSIYFVERTADKEKPAANPAPKEKTPGSLNLKAQRIEAVGRPAVVTAPSRNLISRASRLAYDLQKNAISLEDAEEAFLQQGPNEIHAKTLYYQAAAPGCLGQIAAQGPGWLRGQSVNRPDQQLEAAWKDKLTLTPDGKSHVISLTGGAKLNCRGVGLLEAQEIFFWLQETPPAAKGQQSRLHPDRMLARNNVRMNSPKLSGKVDQLEAWFEDRGQGLGNAGLAMGINGQESAAGRPVPENKERAGNGGQNNLTPPAQQNPQAPVQRFEVLGRLLQVKLVLGGPQVAVSHLTIEDGVRFTEMQADRPLTIRGDRLEAVDLMGSSGSATITGRPAHFEDKGLGLSGSNIKVNRAENRLWIDGPGQMDAPLSGAVPGQPSGASGTAGTLTITWRQRMEFNGQTAKFEDNVVAATGQQQMRTATMLVQMQRPVSFMDQNPQEPPQIDEIQCRGGVLLENRAFDQQQQLTAYDRMEVTDMAVKVQSGAMTAGGPGWLNSVRRGSANPLPVAGQPPADSPQSPLTCLTVKFQKSIIGSLPPGNIWHRKMTFSDRVRMSYAPVADWDAMLSVDNPDILGPLGVAVRCDQLSVVDMPMPIGNRRSMELEALGNAVVENMQYTARGHRIAYSEFKDMLILQGDGRNDAELFMQQGVGASPSQHAAQKIIYWPKSKQLKIEKARTLEIGAPVAGPKSKL